MKHINNKMRLEIIQIHRRIGRYWIDLTVIERMSCYGSYRIHFIWLMNERTCKISLYMYVVHTKFIVNIIVKQRNNGKLKNQNHLAYGRHQAYGFTQPLY